MDIFKGELDRLGYLAWFLFTILIGIGFGLVIDANKLHHSGEYWLGLRILVAVVIVALLFISTSKRLRSVKASQWLLLVLLVPVVSTILCISLLFLPPKKNT